VQLIGELETFLREKRAKLSSKSDLARAIDYMLKRWLAFTRAFLNDGRICPDQQRPQSGRCGASPSGATGSDEGRRRAAAMYTPIETAKLSHAIRQPHREYLFKASIASLKCGCRYFIDFYCQYCRLIVCRWRRDMIDFEPEPRQKRS
jgi:hypothetical protein